mmetsp:Transcript_40539/g.114757  ORF Transcript_40539/g.114757 Transcript_40539/m.114757 type:complete len:207 (-) Transcript_40539:60-680(-)
MRSTDTCDRLAAGTGDGGACEGGEAREGPESREAHNGHVAESAQQLLACDADRNAQQRRLRWTLRLPLPADRLQIPRVLGLRVHQLDVPGRGACLLAGLRRLHEVGAAQQEAVRRQLERLQPGAGGERPPLQEQPHHARVRPRRPQARRVRARRAGALPAADEGAPGAAGPEPHRAGRAGLQLPSGQRKERRRLRHCEVAAAAPAL